MLSGSLRLFGLPRVRAVAVKQHKSVTSVEVSEVFEKHDAAGVGMLLEKMNGYNGIYIQEVCLCAFNSVCARACMHAPVLSLCLALSLCERVRVRVRVRVRLFSVCCKLRDT